MADLEISESQLAEFAKSVEVFATLALEGLHRSRRSGQGVEFHSALPYGEGEDSKFIDWKRFAASDRLYVNRFDRDERTRWAIAVDRSESMLYEQKAKRAREFAGALLFLAKTWGDSFELYGLDGMRLDEAYLHLVDRKEGFSDWKKLSKWQPRPARMVLLSDLFDEPTTVSRAIQTFQAEGHQVILCQVLDASEIDFHFEAAALEFEDLESKDRLVFDTELSRAGYQKLFEKHSTEIESALEGNSFLLRLQADGRNLSADLEKFFDLLNERETQ